MVFERNRRILHVRPGGEEDGVIRGYLEGAGFLVLEVSSIAAALQTLYPVAAEDCHAEVAAVLLDETLDGASVAEATQRIKGTPCTSGVPVVRILTSSTPAPLDEDGSLDGADAYVTEPVRPAELVSLLNALIRSRECERALRFQAEVRAKLTASFEYEQTLLTIEKAFSPYFADECFACLSVPHVVDPAMACMPEHLPDGLYEIALRVGSGEQAGYFDPLTMIVPLKVGGRRLGSLVFRLRGDGRSYRQEAVAFAEDLAGWSALALQNAVSLAVQQTTQLALVQSEKLATAGRFSAAIAHEINNPLEAITNLIFLIDTHEGVSAGVKAYAEAALSELSRLTHIARRSLGFYRELTGPAIFDLNESVEETLNIYLKRFEAKHIEVERSYTPGLTLFAVKGEIRQVISNLLVNAYDVLPEYGMLRVETAGSNDNVCFRVADNGQGIPERSMPRIFEPFYTTKKDSGTGLGLWVSENIVQKHGGRIEVESRAEEEPRGTKFTVTLPRRSAMAA